MSEWVRPWLSPEDLAAELDVPLRSVYVWNHKGTGPAATKVGKHVRYSRKAVDQWLAARTETPLASWPKHKAPAMGWAGALQRRLVRVGSQRPLSYVPPHANPGR